MRILIADDDPTYRELVEETLRGSLGYECLIASDGTEALDFCLRPDGPEIVLLDWMMPKLTGTQVSRLVRGAALAKQPQIIFMTARTRLEEHLACLSAGGDDVLSKPFGPDLLVARIELAAQRFHKQLPPQDFRLAVQGAVREGNGELLVRSDALVARILISEGKIAWVHAPSGSGSFLTGLEEKGSLDRDTALAVVKECRTSGRGLVEVLAEWDLLKPEELRAHAAAWLRARVAELLELKNPKLLFLPGIHRCSKELLFEVDDLLGESWFSTEPSLPPPTTLSPSAFPPPRSWSRAFQGTASPPATAQALVESCLAIDGLCGVAVLELQTGRCLSKGGTPLDPDVAWAQLGTLHAVARNEEAAQSVVVGSQHYHLAAFTKVPAPALVYATIRVAQVNLGTARADFVRAIERAAALSPDD